MIFVLRVVSLVLVLVLTACKSGPQVTPGTEEKAPAFTGQKLGGGEQVFDPAALQHPTLLVFWASWCVSCKEELPLVLDIDRSRRGLLDVIGVSVDEQVDRAEVFAQDAKLPYPNLTDSKLAIADLFKVTGTPSFVLVGRHGEVRHVAKSVDEGLLSAIALAVQ